MLQYDWEDSPGYWIASTLNTLKRALNAEFSRENITLRQWEVLACLAFEGALSQAELAERLGIEAPTLVGILDRMERDGWLDRQCCPNDRRRKRIYPTQKAESLWARMSECAHQVRARAIRGIDPEELAQLKSLCTRIRLNLAEEAAAAPPEEVSASLEENEATPTSPDHLPPLVAPGTLSHPA